MNPSSGHHLVAITQPNNGDIIQPFPVQICKLPYTSFAVVLRTDRGNQKQICQDVILIYTVVLVVCLAVLGAAVENEGKPLGRWYAAVRSLPWGIASFCVQSSVPKSNWGSGATVLRTRFHPKAIMQLRFLGLLRRWEWKCHVSGSSQAAQNSYSEIIRRCELCGRRKKLAHWAS